MQVKGKERKEEEKNKLIHVSAFSFFFNFLFLQFLFFLQLFLFFSSSQTPIKIALRWFMKRNPLSTHRVTPHMLDGIPGRVSDRKTPLGELNWVFTAITDTIAWNVLSREQVSF